MILLWKVRIISKTLHWSAAITRLCLIVIFRLKHFGIKVFFKKKKHLYIPVCA
jgi:hypothetical protein